MLMFLGLHSYILIAAAVLPAIFLMRYVYQSDRLEKESPQLLRRLVLYGILATLSAYVIELIGTRLLNLFVSSRSSAYAIIEFFGIVAFAEEGSKYFFLRRATWQHQEFNCQYDGVVYATFVSLGFALWENIRYVLSYGFQTALIRAITAIPGHACFGVFMGVWYGLARRYENAGKHASSMFCQTVALLLPAFLHGLYDYIATVERAPYSWVFVIFVIALFLVSFLLVRYASKKDKYIGTSAWRIF